MGLLSLHRIICLRNSALLLALLLFFDHSQGFLFWPTSCARFNATIYLKHVHTAHLSLCDWLNFCVEDHNGWRERNLHLHFRAQTSRRVKSMIIRLWPTFTGLLNLNLSPTVRLSTQSLTVTLWGIWGWTFGADNWTVTVALCTENAGAFLATLTQSSHPARQTHQIRLLPARPLRQNQSQVSPVEEIQRASQMFVCSSSELDFLGAI